MSSPTIFDGAAISERVLYCMLYRVSTKTTKPTTVVTIRKLIEQQEQTITQHPTRMHQTVTPYIEPVPNATSRGRFLV